MTVTTKIAKNGARLYYVESKRVSRDKALEVAAQNRVGNPFVIEYDTEQTHFFVDAPSEKHVYTDRKTFDTLNLRIDSYKGFTVYCGTGEIRWFASNVGAKKFAAKIEDAFINGEHGIKVTLDGTIGILPGEVEAEISKENIGNLTDSALAASNSRLAAFRTVEETAEHKFIADVVRESANGSRIVKSKMFANAADAANRILKFYPEYQICEGSKIRNFATDETYELSEVDLQIANHEADNETNAVSTPAKFEVGKRYLILPRKTGTVTVLKRNRTTIDFCLTGDESKIIRRKFSADSVYAHDAESVSYGRHDSYFWFVAKDVVDETAEIEQTADTVVEAQNFAVIAEIEEAEQAAFEARCIARVLADDDLAARYEKAKSQVKCQRYENGWRGWYFKGKNRDEWEYDATKAAACLSRYGLSRAQFGTFHDAEVAVIDSNGYDETAFDFLPNFEDDELRDYLYDFDERQQLLEDKYEPNPTVEQAANTVATNENPEPQITTAHKLDEDEAAEKFYCETEATFRKMQSAAAFVHEFLTRKIFDIYDFDYALSVRNQRNEFKACPNKFHLVDTRFDVEVDRNELEYVIYFGGTELARYRKIESVNRAVDQLVIAIVNHRFEYAFPAELPDKPAPVIDEDIAENQLPEIAPEFKRCGS